MRWRALALALAAGLAGCSAAADQARICSAVRPGWSTPAEGVPDHVLVNRVSVSGTGALKWNGVPIGRARLREFLAIVREMEPLPFTILRQEGEVDCAFLESVRDDLAGALPCAEGYCGEGQGRWGPAYGPRRLSPDGERASANAIAEMEEMVEAAERLTDEASVSSPER
jgi:hypothetical protein